MGKKIYLSPSSQPENTYAYGNTNEQVQCRRIADACEVALKRCGFEVKNGNSGTIYTRVAESNAWGADLHVPIHTNAYNGNVSGTRIFCFNGNGEGNKAAQAVFKTLAPITPGTSESITANPSLYEVNDAAAPTVYVEAEFHDVAACAKWIIENVEAIGEAICQGICNYFKVEYKAPVKVKYSVVFGEYSSSKDADAALADICAKVVAAENALNDALSQMVALDKELHKAKVVKE